MAHFAVIAPPLRGHYKPLSHLAAELMARGHRATFIHHPDASGLVETEGAGFEAIGLGAPAISRWTRPMARIRGAIGMSGMMDGMVGFTDMICREAPAVLRRIGADALIVDQLEPAGALIAEHLGLPFVTAANTVPINREPGIPPPYLGWRFDPSPGGIRRNLGGWRVTDVLLRKIYRGIDRNARMLGVTPGRRLEDCLSPLLQLTQLVPSIDFPRAELPAHFHYAGPFRRGRPEPFELPPGDDRPLVFCTLGTLQGSRITLFRKVAAACARLDLRLLITQGGLADVRSAGKLPGDPLVYDWVPQEAALRHADLIVCHGGINTILEPLSAGLPMVLMPLAFDQAANAARMEHAGVAKELGARASARRISEAIAAVRSDPAFAARAGAVQAEIRAAGGVARAADLIEQALGLGAGSATATTARAAPNDVRNDIRNGNS